MKEFDKLPDCAKSVLIDFVDHNDTGKLWVHGSWVKGGYDPETSDIDITVENYFKPRRIDCVDISIIRYEKSVLIYDGKNFV